MTMRNILVPMHANLDPAPQLDAALQVAQSFGGSIGALYVRPNVAVELALVADAALAGGISFEHFERAARETATRVHEQFDAWRTSQAAASRPAAWSEHEGFLEAVLERQGRLADLIVLRHPDPKLPETASAFDAAVFGTGRPCILVRNTPRKPLLQHVVVSWNGSLEGTHAVVGAMPLLQAAGQVSVFSARRPDGDDKHGSELADALSRNGIVAQALPHAETAWAVGAQLLEAADAAGATLIVMGAYTRSRVRQMLLGGVTRHVLQHTALPVLMTH